MFRLTMCRNRRKLLAEPKLLGRWGQKQTEKFLAAGGFRTIARNFNCSVGELDLVMADPDGCIVFVEVKTRRDENYTPARGAVTAAKQKRMSRAAKIFAGKYDLKDRPMRFDVVTVILGDKKRPVIRHYENAFRQ